MGRISRSKVRGAERAMGIGAESQTMRDRRIRNDGGAAVAVVVEGVPPSGRDIGFGRVLMG